MLITRAELEGRAPLDVRLAEGRVLEIAPRLRPRAGEAQLDAAGGALLPGLRDHHLHLLSLAASLASVVCGPPQVRDAAGLERALSRATPSDGWLRGVGYHESVAGTLDRARLDALSPPGVRVRVQHRSGACWMLNGAASLALRLEEERRPGVERDAAGRATGRLFRMDDWLAERVGTRRPDLAAAGALLARRGVVAVTDASASNDAGRLAALEDAVSRGSIPQRVRVLGGPDLPAPASSRVARGAVKIVLDDARLLDPDELACQLRAARAAHRAVALHCVTRGELALAVAAWQQAGAAPGDRVEHASVAPPELARELARLGVTAVLQPGFVFERGDDYLRDVAPVDRPWLYRARGLREAGVAIAAGTDAPFAEPDPWRAMQAATERRTRSGAVLGGDESLTPEQALALFTTPLGVPGGPACRVHPGAPADLCLLAAPWRRCRHDLAAVRVRATFIGGARAHPC